MDIDYTLQKLWELDNVQGSIKLEPEDEQVQKHFLATHSRDLNRNYVVKLSFNSENPELGESLHGALKHFKSVVDYDKTSSHGRICVLFAGEYQYDAHA